MRALALLLLACLTGCASTSAFFTGPVPLYDEVNIRVRLVDHIPGGYIGRATWAGPNCDVVLLRSHYPRCLQHEGRHCFEGPFHGPAPSDEDCYAQ